MSGLIIAQCSLEQPGSPPSQLWTEDSQHLIVCEEDLCDTDALTYILPIYWRLIFEGGGQQIEREREHKTLSGTEYCARILGSLWAPAHHQE